MSQPDSTTLPWEIANFANLNSLKDFPDFKIKQTVFWLRLFPNDNLQYMGKNIIICLMRSGPHTTDVKVLWTISLANDKGEECYPKVLETNFTVQSAHYPIDGGLYNLNRDMILNPSNGLLAGGKLTVKFTVTILDDKNMANFAKLSIDAKTVTFAHKKALENYRPHLEKSKFSDVVFVIGKKEFKLHKIILSAQSPVFSAMFENDLEEAKQNRVEITDVDVEVFEAMIRFIYTGNVDSVQQYALDLFVAADKYHLESLKDICAQSLGSNLNIESVANVLLVADMHSAQELKSKCIKFINENASKVFVTDGWKQLVKQRHELVLDLYYNMAKFEDK